MLSAATVVVRQARVAGRARAAALSVPAAARAVTVAAWPVPVVMAAGGPVPVAAQRATRATRVAVERVAAVPGAREA